MMDEPISSSTGVRRRTRFQPRWGPIDLERSGTPTPGGDVGFEDFDSDEFRFAFHTFSSAGRRTSAGFKMNKEDIGR